MGVAKSQRWSQRWRLGDLSEHPGEKGTTCFSGGDVALDQRSSDHHRFGCRHSEFVPSERPAFVAASGLQWYCSVDMATGVPCKRCSFYLLFSWHASQQWCLCMAVCAISSQLSAESVRYLPNCQQICAISSYCQQICRINWATRCACTCADGAHISTSARKWATTCRVRLQ
jgi:hypothetical protein